MSGAIKLTSFSQSRPLVVASPHLGEFWPAREVPAPAFAPSSYHADSVLWESIKASLLNRQIINSPPSGIVEDSLKDIEAHYIITEGKEWVRRLLYTQRGLSKLLLEAVQPSRKAFGDRLIQLQGLSDGDDLSLVATIQWPDDAKSARAARNDFDQQWWLDNCNRAHGYVVFDYELVDAV